MPSSQLTAHYTSPTNSQTFSFDLPSAPSPDSNVADKTAYLSSLRKNVSDMQAQVNSYLTARMEQDKRAEGQKAAGEEQEKREEDMYGEEDPEAEG